MFSLSFARLHLCLASSLAMLQHVCAWKVCPLASFSLPAADATRDPHSFKNLIEVTMKRDKLRRAMLQQQAASSGAPKASVSAPPVQLDAIVAAADTSMGREEQQPSVQEGKADGPVPENSYLGSQLQHQLEESDADVLPTRRVGAICMPAWQAEPDICSSQLEHSQSAPSDMMKQAGMAEELWAGSPDNKFDTAQTWPHQTTLRA